MKSALKQLDLTEMKTISGGGLIKRYFWNEEGKLIIRWMWKKEED